MIDTTYKKITREVFKEDVISEWVQPKDFKLSMCTIYNELFRMNLNLVYGNFEEFIKFLKHKYNFETKHESADGLYVELKHEKVVWNFLLITKNNWCAEDYGIICHELHHFTHFALDEKGVSYGLGGEEVYAYFQGYFMELIIRAFIQLKKHGKLPKIKRSSYPD